MMKTKAAQEDERRDFDQLKTQLFTLQSRLGDQATREAEDEAKNAKKPWASKRTTGAMLPPDRSVYFDDFARKQGSPSRAQAATAGPSGHTSLSRPVPSIQGGGGACEWDRLMREREDLLQTGTYTPDDPLIKEIDRQI